MPNAKDELTIKIRLVKEWDDGVNPEWPLGQVLMATEKGAETLVKQGVAEIYEAKATDRVFVSPLGGNMIEEELEGTIRRIADERIKENTAQTIVTGEDDYIKRAGFHSMSHFAMEVYKAGPGEQGSQAINKWDGFCKAEGLSEGVGADGGVLLPTEFRSELLRIAMEESFISSRATSIPMQTNSIKIPIVMESSRASSFFGGVIIYRPDEAAQITKSKPQFSHVKLELNKLAGLAYVTSELLEDSPMSLQPILTTMFGQALGYQMDDDFVNGTGAGQPLGILNAGCLISVSAETGQTSSELLTLNILNMWARMFPGSHPYALWMANPTCFPQLAQLSLSVGTGGSGVGLLRGDATGAVATSLLGKPLQLTSHCQSLGTKGDLILADWRQYLVGQKVGASMKVDSSIHLRFDYDETAFRFISRYDGQPWWTGALTPKRGDSLSPFVTLETRS
ncbi:MAG: phage major capsid protein [Gemmatimonadales bacterium]|nr:phage major capsid protein [Gemmatimonadales bacterium]